MSEQQRRCITEELTHVAPNGKLSVIWGQAVSEFTGVKSYGLERIGLWPKPSEE